jgi:hypothetical protein
MNAFPKRANTAPLTPEQAAVFRRLLADEKVVVTGEHGLVLRDPLLEVVMTVWPAEEDEEEAGDPAAAAGGGEGRLPLWEVTSPAVAMVFQQGQAAATPAVLAELAEMLGDADPAVRAAAARAVRALGGAAATPGVLGRLPRLLHDPQAEVRDTAGAALAGMGGAAVTPTLLAALARLVFSPDWRVGAAAAEAVQRLGCAEAIEPYLKNAAPPSPGPEPDADSAPTGVERGSEGRFDVYASAYEPGGRRVRLDGLTLYARGEDGMGKLLRIGHVMGRGDLVIEGLRAGVGYRLHSPAVSGWSGQPVLLPVRSKAGAAAGQQTALAPWEWPEYKSVEGKVQCVVRPLPGDEAAITFETKEAELAGATVRFALVQKSGRVEYSDEVRLEPAGEGTWEKRWTGPVRLAAPCELVFDVVPARPAPPVEGVP